MPTSWSPSRSSRMPGIVSARTRLPLSCWAATSPVVCSSVSSSSIPISRRCSASCLRDFVVELVTKRRRCPSARRRPTALAAPAIGSPETCRTPSTSSRIAAMDTESIRSEIAFRFSRSSGPGGQHAQKSSTRAEAIFDVEGSAALDGRGAHAGAREARRRSSARWRRTSARSCATASSRPTGSSSSCARRRRCAARAGRRSRRRHLRSAASTRRSKRGATKRLRRDLDD